MRNPCVPNAPYAGRHAMQCNAVQQQGGVRIGSEAVDTHSTGSEEICL